MREKFTDSNGQEQVVDATMLVGTTLPDGSTAGVVAAIPSSVSGVPERYKITFDAASETPANPAAVTPSEVIQITPTAGKQYALVTVTADEGMTPFVIAANVTLNANDRTVAADRLSIADLTEGADITSADSTDGQIVDSRNSLLFDLSRVENDSIQKLHLVGVATGGTGAASKTIVTVTVF